MVKVAVMLATERNGKFVTDLAGHCPRLREANMVGIRRRGAAKQAGLRCNEPQVILVPDPMRFREGKGGLFDAAAG